MPRELLLTWTVGKDRITHAGYAVYTLRRETPADQILTFESAERAVDSAERLGADHGAFRITEPRRGTQPRERIMRADLPVTVVLKPTESKK